VGDECEPRDLSASRLRASIEPYHAPHPRDLRASIEPYHAPHPRDLRASIEPYDAPHPRDLRASIEPYNAPHMRLLSSKYQALFCLSCLILLFNQGFNLAGIHVLFLDKMMSYDFFREGVWQQCLPCFIGHGADVPMKVRLPQIHLFTLSQLAKGPAKNKGSWLSNT